MYNEKPGKEVMKEDLKSWITKHFDNIFKKSFHSQEQVLLSFSSCINCAVLLPVGFCFQFYLLVALFAIIPELSEHSKLDIWDQGSAAEQW